MESKLLILNGATHLNLEGTCSYRNGTYKNGETSFVLECSVQNEPVTIVQSFPNTNENLMELMIAIDACRRAGASTITTILPVFPYARQDRKHTAGAPISAKVVCDMLKINCNRIITFDLHNDAIQGFLGSTAILDHVEVTSFLAASIRQHIPDYRDWVLVAPDAGAVKRTKKIADALEIQDLAIMDKTRTSANVVDRINLIGDVSGRNVIVADDMIDTAGTCAKAAKELRNKGAKEIILLATHGIFSEPAYTNLQGLSVMCTNTLPIPEVDSQGTVLETLQVLDISPFIQKLIQLTNANSDLGPLFKRWEI